MNVVSCALSISIGICPSTLKNEGLQNLACVDFFCQIERINFDIFLNSDFLNLSIRTIGQCTDSTIVILPDILLTFVLLCLSSMKIKVIYNISASRPLPWSISDAYPFQWCIGLSMNTLTSLQLIQCVLTTFSTVTFSAIYATLDLLCDRIRWD